MTTHETRPETVAHEAQPETTTPEARPDTADPVFADAGAAPIEADPPRVGEPGEPVEPIGESVDPAVDLESQQATVDPVESAGSADQMLFADGELSGLRSRWTQVQSAFVDDPRDCVQKADGLVADVVDKLTAGFSAARSGLEEQWDRGEEVSTEDLRIALKRYREFFERLLAV